MHRRAGDASRAQPSERDDKRSFPVRSMSLLSRSLIADNLARPFLLINVSLFGLVRRFFAPTCSSHLRRVEQQS